MFPNLSGVKFVCWGFTIKDDGLEEFCDADIQRTIPFLSLKVAEHLVCPVSSLEILGINETSSTQNSSISLQLSSSFSDMEC